MNAVEFTTELTGAKTLPIPPEAVARLPKSGRVRVIVLAGENQDDDMWRRSAYEQFLREDSAEDAIYDKFA
jgi:hypothetical protein